jgi:hypothetical protein
MDGQKFESDHVLFPAAARLGPKLRHGTVML